MLVHGSIVHRVCLRGAVGPYRDNVNGHRDVYPRLSRCDQRRPDPPEPLRNQILCTITSCSAVLGSINDVLVKYAGTAGAVKWVMFGKAEVAGLRISLEACRGSLGLVPELVRVPLLKAAKGDITAMRTTACDIKQDTSQIPLILAELTTLRAIAAAGDMPSTTRNQNHLLKQYLDGLTSHAEPVYADVSVGLGRKFARAAPESIAKPVSKALTDTQLRSFRADDGASA